VYTSSRAKEKVDQRNLSANGKFFQKGGIGKPKFGTIFHNCSGRILLAEVSALNHTEGQNWSECGIGPKNFPLVDMEMVKYHDSPDFGGGFVCWDQNEGNLIQI